MLHHVASIIVNGWNLATANVKSTIQSEMIQQLVNSCILASDKRLFNRIVNMLSHIYATGSKDLQLYFEYLIQTKIKPALDAENYQVRWNSLYLFGLVCHPRALAVKLNSKILRDDFVQNRVLAIQETCHVIFTLGISSMHMVDTVLLPLLKDSSNHKVRMTVIKELIPIIRKYNVWRSEWQGMCTKFTFGFVLFVLEMIEPLLFDGSEQVRYHVALLLYTIRTVYCPVRFMNNTFQQN